MHNLLVHSYEPPSLAIELAVCASELNRKLNLVPTSMTDRTQAQARQEHGNGRPRCSGAMYEMSGSISHPHSAGAENRFNKSVRNSIIMQVCMCCRSAATDNITMKKEPTVLYTFLIQVRLFSIKVMTKYASM